MSRVTTPTRIIDRNGRATTVHKAIDPKASTGRMSGTPAITSGATAWSGSKNSELSEAQEEYFANTVAVNEDGTLATVYHGSAHEFSSFDPSRLGRGNDSYGNGFYFTDQEDIAKGYAAESDSGDSNTKEFYINLENPIYVDGIKNSSLDIRFNRAQIANIIKKHPEAYMQPNNEDGDMSFLGDYSARYWDKETHTAAEFDSMLNEVARDIGETGWTELEVMFGRENGSAFLHAIRDETGHDGVIVDFGDIGKHFVAWFPEQMKLTSNTEPDSSIEF